MPRTSGTRLPRFLSAALAAALALALAGCASVTAPAVRAPIAADADPASVIYIGNSFFYFNNGINAHVGGLVRAGMPGVPHRATMVTISGSGFDWHDVESYFRPDAVGRYAFDAENRVVFNKLDRLFDAAVLMDCSQCPVHPQLKPVFEQYAQRHAETVRRHGARPVFFMSWAYKDAPAMTQQLADAYTAAGRQHGARVVPAGLAFARAIAQRPELELYAPDKRHPNLAGSYLSAATTYATLYRRSPVGLGYTAGLDPQLARFLQAVAWETVQAYRQPA